MRRVTKSGHARAGRDQMKPRENWTVGDLYHVLLPGDAAEGARRYVQRAGDVHVLDVEQVRERHFYANPRAAGHCERLPERRREDASARADENADARVAEAPDVVRRTDERRGIEVPVGSGIRECAIADLDPALCVAVKPRTVVPVPEVAVAERRRQEGPTGRASRGHNPTRPQQIEAAADAVGEAAVCGRTGSS